MALSRAILTRATEAVYALVAADADLLAELGGNASQFRFRGPAVDPTSIKARQIDVAPIVDEKWTYQLGELTDSTIAVRVTFWENRSAATPAHIQPGEAMPAVDVPRKIAAIVAASGENRGRLIDPDSDPLDEGTDRYLNHGFGTPQFGVTTNKEETVLGFYVDLVFDTSQDAEGNRA